MIGRDSHHDQIAQQLEQRFREPLRIEPGLAGVAACRERGRGVAFDARGGDSQQHAPVDQVEHLEHRGVADLAARVRDDLVEQRLCVAHRAVGLARDREQARARHRDLLLARDLGEPLDDLGRAQPA